MDDDDPTTGTYVGRTWVTIRSARNMTFPDENGPGVYHGRDWVPVTCSVCHLPPGPCQH